MESREDGVNLIYYDHLFQVMFLTSIFLLGSTVCKA
jgi:hypothetical protein